jgi:hypothetical protein
MGPLLNTTTIPAVLEHSEPRKIAAQKADELAALSWNDLDRFEPRVEVVTSVNGRRFRVKSHTSWDMDAWQSDMCVTVKVYATREYQRSLQLHVLPTLGRRLLSQITPAGIDQLIVQMERDGRAGGTIRNAIGSLRKLPADAARHGLIHTNPALNPDLPPI